MSLGHLLVIEDDPPSRLIVSRSLQRFGYTVEAFGSAVAALGRIENPAAAPFDAAVIDFRLPEMDGLQFVVWLEQHDPALCCIVQSAQSDFEMMPLRDHPRVHAQMAKPLDFARLQTLVGEAVATTRTLRAAAAAR